MSSTKGKDHKNVFDKLTDHSLYTGAHKSRFDSHGNGKGINQTTDDNPRKDMSEFMRPAMRKSASTRESSGSKSSSTLVHHASGTSKRSSTSTTSGGGGGVFDRLTDHKKYTGAHKSRFDANGNGRGINQTTDDNPRKDMSEYMRPNLNTSSRGERVLVHSGSTKSTVSMKSGKSGASAKSGASDKTASSSHSNQGSSSSGIFDRLTDTSKYHGTHKHRFDANGNGRGMDGR